MPKVKELFGNMKSYILLWQMNHRRIFHTRTIYGLATDSGEIFYVGKSGCPESRLQSHLQTAKRRKTLTQKKIHSLRGKVKLIEIEVVRFKGYPSLPNARERYWIGHYSKIFPLTNIKGNLFLRENIIK